LATLNLNLWNIVKFVIDFAFTVKLRYEALHYDTITDMSRWARGPRGIFKVYSETLKFFYIIARKLENVTTLRDLLPIQAGFPTYN